jgi:hypothetical protein
MPSRRTHSHRKRGVPKRHSAGRRATGARLPRLFKEGLIYEQLAAGTMRERP